MPKFSCPIKKCKHWDKKKENCKKSIVTMGHIGNNRHELAGIVLVCYNRGIKK